MPRVRVRVRRDTKPVDPSTVRMQGGGQMMGEAVQRVHA